MVTVAGILKYWHNTWAHVSTNCSPFKAAYGGEPTPLLWFKRGNTTIATLEDQLLKRDAILHDVKAHLIRAQQKMNKQEDSKRRNLEFQVGDSVYLLLQPYQQHS